MISRRKLFGFLGAIPALVGLKFKVKTEPLAHHQTQFRDAPGKFYWIDAPGVRS